MRRNRIRQKLRIQRRHQRSKQQANTTTTMLSTRPRSRRTRTESYFMTELVDHLPASDKVPSPDKVLGYVSARPTSSPTRKIVSLLSRARESHPARSRVHRARKSEEGREQMLWLSATKPTLPSSIATKRSPQSLPTRARTDADARQLIGEGKGFTGRRARSTRPRRARPRC